MLTSNKSDENLSYINPIQTKPIRNSIYLMNRCEDQVIGFEFVSKKYNQQTSCCSSLITHLCAPIEIISPIDIVSAEFQATDDECYKEWIVKKTTVPSIELQLNQDNKVIGVLVRFFSNETCCYPFQMAFKLFGIDNQGCKYSLSSGLLVFK